MADVVADLIAADDSELMQLQVLNVEEVHLRINYRTPAEMTNEARLMIREVIPYANVPRSIRQSGVPVRHVRTGGVHSLISAWLASRSEGIVCVTVMGSAELKGPEFDLVILVDPRCFGTRVQGGVDRYVPMTRATAELVIAVHQTSA